MLESIEVDKMSKWILFRINDYIKQMKISIILVRKGYGGPGFRPYLSKVLGAEQALPVRLKTRWQQESEFNKIYVNTGRSEMVPSQMEFEVWLLVGGKK
jgi:hypothetical protein